jgi:hypothetical protein
MLDNNIWLNIVESGTLAVFGWKFTNLRLVIKRPFKILSSSVSLGRDLVVDMEHRHVNDLD